MVRPSSPLGRVAVGLAALVTAGCTQTASADPGTRGSSWELRRDASRAARPGSRIHPTARRRGHDRIGNFAEQKRREARQALRLDALERERGRRLEELRRRGDPSALEQYRRESEALELRNELAFRNELRQLDAFLAQEDLGPVTRRIFDRHRAGLLERQARLRRDLGDRHTGMDAEPAREGPAPFLGTPP